MNEIECKGSGFIVFTKFIFKKNKIFNKNKVTFNVIKHSSITIKFNSQKNLRA